MTLGTLALAAGHPALLAISRAGLPDCRLDDDFDCHVGAEKLGAAEVMLGMPMPNAPVLGQVSEIADQVWDRMIIASPAVLLENRDSLGGPGDMVGFVGRAQPPRGFANSAGRRRSRTGCCGTIGRQAIGKVLCVICTGGLG